MSRKKSHKELAGNHLPNKPSMRLYGGYILSKMDVDDNGDDSDGNDSDGDDNGDKCSEYRFRLYVPTTIFDYKRAVLKVYHMESPLHQTPEVPEEVIATEYVRLNSLPHWNRSYQTLMLSRRDEKKVISASKSLEKRLEMR